MNSHQREPRRLSIVFVAVAFVSVLSICLRIIDPRTSLSSRGAMVSSTRISSNDPPQSSRGVDFEQKKNVDSNEDKCDAIMQRFHTNNALYRLSSAKAAAPIFVNAEFHGQGFGRVIEHTVHTCLLGIMLDRPCIVDLSRRDEHYTWRSFINTGTYDWGVHGQIEEFLPNITEAIDKHDGKECWKKPVVDYPNIIPMTKPSHWPETGSYHSIDSLQNGTFGQWSANNETVRDKILVSSNWCCEGWFPMLKFPEKYKGCEWGELKSRVQNAMYKPTDLSQNLHKERSTKVLDIFTDGGMQVHYGAIHLRTLFLKNRKEVGNAANVTLEEEVTSKIASCLRHFDSISKWIIMSDEPDVAKYVSKKLPNMHHGYDDEFVLNNLHSLAAAETIYDHKHMAPNIMDWMVLHESALSLVGGHGTAFGETGSHGNGKSRRPFDTSAKHDCSLFGAGYFKAA